MRLSKLAQGIQTSPIITLAADINEKIQSGEKIYNLTIGDFNPKVFPIPTEFRDEIIAAYNAGYTNYPGALGLPNLRNSVSRFLGRYGGLQYDPDEILIACGSRPLIYSSYRAIVDPGDKVIFPVPSWNNDYYSYLTFAEQIMIETTPENNFMPNPEDIKPHLKEASLIALCSPLNPTGTVFSQSGLEDICDLVLEENKSRGPNKKPLYMVFDQIYWLLTFGEHRHFDPVSLRPEMREYVVYIDGMSKAFASTGVRLGWGFAAPDILKKMRRPYLISEIIEPIDILRKNHIKHALVNGGGDIRVIGGKTDDLPWKIGLFDPLNRTRLFTSIELDNQAIATSGPYYRRFNDLLDPRIGRPAQDILISTIIAKKAIDADVLATAFFVLGRRKGMNLLDRFGGVQALYVTNEGDFIRN